MKQTSGVRVRPKTTSRTVTVTDEGLCEQRVFLVCWDESDGRRLSDTAVDCIWPCDWWTRGWLVGLRCLTTIRRDPDTVGLRQSYWRYTAGVLPIRMPANLRSVRLASVKTSHELIMESRCLLSTEKKTMFRRIVLSMRFLTGNSGSFELISLFRLVFRERNRYV